MAGQRGRVPILYVHHRPELGGAPTSLSYFIKMLDRERFTPHVLCPPGPAAELFESAGATVHTGPVAGFTHIWASSYEGRRWVLLGRELVRLPAHIKTLGNVLREGRFGLVHLNDSPLIPAALRVHRAGMPIVWHLRSALPPNDGRHRSDAIRRTIKRLSAATVAINDDVAASYSAGSIVIPNPVDLERFRPGPSDEAKRELGIPADIPLVGLFGFIYPSKGYRDFIEAAALVRRRGLNARFMIVGGDVRGEHFFTTALGRTLRRLDLARNYEHEAKEIAARLNLEDMVTFVPFTVDTAALYRASDIVVSPSRGPELGRPVLEAAASGRPVIASGSLSGGGTVLPSDTGLLVPKRSPDVLAAALEQLLSSAELRARLGANARAHAEQHFSPQRNTDRLMAIYDDVLGSDE